MQALFSRTELTSKSFKNDLLLKRNEMKKQRAAYQNRTGIFCLEGRHNNLYTNAAGVSSIFTN